MCVCLGKYTYLICRHTCGVVLVGPLHHNGPYSLGRPKRDHNFDNLPYLNIVASLTTEVTLLCTRFCSFSVLFRSWLTVGALQGIVACSALGRFSKPGYKVGPGGNGVTTNCWKISPRIHIPIAVAYIKILHQPMYVQTTSYLGSWLWTDSKLLQQVL